MTNSLIAERDRFAAQNPETSVDIAGREWGVLEAGTSGPELLLLPGTLGRADVFWRQFERLAGRARIVAVTYPATWDIAEWCRDLTAILDRAGIASATVLGSSLGGYVAQYFAAAHADRCRALIAANTLASTVPLAQIPPYSADLANTPVEALRGGFHAAMEGQAKTHPERAELVGLLLAEVDGRIPGEQLRARLMALKHAPELPACGLDRSRIAVIEAADDPLIPAPIRDGVRERLHPDVTYRFREGGHFPYIARPDAYAAILEERLGLAHAGEDWGSGELREK